MRRRFGFASSHPHLVVEIRHRRFLQEDFHGDQGLSNGCKYPFRARPDLHPVLLMPTAIMLTPGVDRGWKAVSRVRPLVSVIRTAVPAWSPAAWRLNDAVIPVDVPNGRH